MSRWRASGMHLLLSFMIIGGIALSALMVWYPHGLYKIAGQDRLLLIMLGIDLVAGPLLTLVIYRQGKRGLKLDLAIIALCQLAFMGYGLHTLWASRPVFLVANGLRFNLVFANELEAEQLALAPRPQWRRLSWAGPQVVGVQAPADEATRQALLLAFMATGVDLDKLPRYYVDYTRVAPTMVRQAQVTGDPAYRQVPVVSRYDQAWMWIDARTAVPVKVAR